MADKSYRPSDYFSDNIPPHNPPHQMVEMEIAVDKQLQQTLAFQELVDKFSQQHVTKKFKILYVAMAEIRSAFTSMYRSFGNHLSEIQEREAERQALIDSLQSQVDNLSARLSALETQKPQVPEQLDLEL